MAGLDELMMHLLSLEHAGWRSLCDGTASDFYGELMTDDALMVLANGDVMTHDDVVRALDGAPTWTGYSIDAPRLVHVGPDTAALVYVGSGRRDGSPPFVGAMSSVYRHEDGRWRLTLYQQTARP
jgi:hypothetical protein